MPRSLLKRFSVLGVARQAGFTMIELLVVISVIGVLAVAVLSSINPIEQINKGRDTRTRSDAAQLINAIDRYVAIHEEYPWNTAINNTAPNTSEFDDLFEFQSDDWTTVDQAAGWPSLLVSTSEVKDGFINRQYANANLEVIKLAGYDENSVVCFIPSSNAFKQEAFDDCQAGGKNVAIDAAATVDLCPGAAPTDDNYICLP